MTNSVIRPTAAPHFCHGRHRGRGHCQHRPGPDLHLVLHWGYPGRSLGHGAGQLLSFAESLLPAAAQDLPSSVVVVSLVCNIMLFRYGSLSVYGPDIPISVISIETKVYTIVINLVVGVVLGGQPILGYNYGAARYDRVRGTYRLILAVTLVVGVAATLLFQFWPQGVVGIFGQGDPLYWEFAIQTFRIFLALITFTCFVKMSSIFFQAVGKPVKATASSLIRDLVCFVPLAIVLPRFFGLQGILYAAPAADLISMIVAVLLTNCRCCNRSAYRRSRCSLLDVGIRNSWYANFFHSAPGRGASPAQP